MWKLIPSKDSEKTIIVLGADYQIRRASNVLATMKFTRQGSYCQVEIKDGVRTLQTLPLYRAPTKVDLKYVRQLCWAHLDGNSIEIWDQKCPNGVKAIPEQEPVKPRSQKFIIWCPQSDLPPRVVLETEEVAKNVATDMAKRHHKTFYWARLEGFVESKKVTTYTEVMKTL